MKGKYIYYSILEYRHSLALNERIYIGILMWFSDTHELVFELGDLERPKLIYPDFNTYVDVICKHIIEKMPEYNYSLDTRFEDDQRFFDFIHDNILRENDDALQFAKPKIGLNTFDTNEICFKAYSDCLLPKLSLKPNKGIK